MSPLTYYMWMFFCFVLTLFNKNQENPFLLLMGFTHLYSLRASANASTLAFAASRIEYSLAASTPEIKTPPFGLKKVESRKCRVYSQFKEFKSL